MASISITCPSCSATEGVVRNGKSTAGHQRYLCSHCRKTWQLQFTYTASQPAVGKLTQPGSDVIVCAEMDEQWGYVGAKSRQRWLFYAYDRIRRTVVAHVFGERTLATLERLLSLLSAFEVVVWMTDDWPLYESRLKGELHDKVIGHYLNIKHYQ
ncbi:IS1 family transposase [Klebsiella pneumoniae]|uniref:IS1 family transposase n=1 Tax=Klebsiella pneumoniae TaxID=573 RepID=UPI0015845F85|nr:IS1 family transposase [Klebsiella pneumoniae]